MIESILFSLVMFVALSLYAYANNIRRKQIQQDKREKPDFFICVEAGDTPEVSAKELEEKSFFDIQKCYLDEDGKTIDMSNMQCLVVNNNCMLPRGIKNGDRLLAQKINVFRSVYEQITSGDILWINIADTGKNKIRIFESKNDDGDLVTFYYDSNGCKKYSSKPHSISSVRGIVKFNLSVAQNK